MALAISALQKTIKNIKKHLTSDCSLAYSVPMKVATPYNAQTQSAISHSVQTHVAVVRNLVGAMRAYESSITLKGVSLAQFHILDRLAEAENGLHQKQLVDALETAKSSGLSAMLKKMEDEEGWIMREIDRTNRRTMKIRLLPKGRQMWAEAAPIYHDLLKQKLGKMKSTTLNRMVTDLQALRELLLTK